MKMVNRTTGLFLMALAATANAVLPPVGPAETGLANQGRFAADVELAVDVVTDRSDSKARDDEAHGGVSGGDCPAGATGSCCQTHPTPGCNDPSCCDAVCASSPACCDPASLFGWDSNCRALAFNLCGDKCEQEVCDNATGSCCQTHPTPGCNDPSCCDAVCTSSPACCDPASLFGWDSNCRALAFNLCGDKCEQEVCDNATGSCCQTHPAPGCNDPSCCDAVCASSPACCDPASLFGWDSNCRALAFNLCGDKCEQEVCDNATGSCCQTHPAPGCNDPSCCDAVCASSPACCDPASLFGWDSNCRALAFNLCGDKCEQEVCDNATGSCCQTHPAPGCDDPTCCDAVCASSPACCDPASLFGWDSNCRATAETVCATLCTGACCEPDGCRQTTPDDCTTVNAFQGLGTECQSLQACCFGDGSCEDLATVCCVAQGGTPSGASTSCTASCCTDADCPPDPNECFDSLCDLTDHACKQVYIPECRVSVSKKGSLLYYSKIELRWDATAPFALRQDTFLTIVNDYPDEVCVHWYFINGDGPTAAVFNGTTLVERAHPGWNNVNFIDCMTEDESTYYSARNGNPMGAQPFTILDRGSPPGRPDPSNPTQRVLRGYAIAFAVDQLTGAELCWNHLSGHVDIVNYADLSAWEYNAYAFQATPGPPDRKECETPGTCATGFSPCGTPPAGSVGCVCAKRPDGTGNCVIAEDRLCDSYLSCPNGDSDCPAGTKCFIDSCCEFPVCVENCPSAPQGVTDCAPGDHLDAEPGVLHLDGTEYDFAFDKLLFDFYAVGSQAFSLGTAPQVQLDTDLTLYPVSVNLQPGNSNVTGPVITQAHFDIWNQNEDEQSGVERCISCWDQELLSLYALSNSFLFGNLQTDKGKARIDGRQSDACDGPGTCCCPSVCSITNAPCGNSSDCPPVGTPGVPQTCGLFNCFDPDCDQADFLRGRPDRDCSKAASLLGVSNKILAFSGVGIPAGTRTDAGMNLVGQGTESATIKHDLIIPPEPLTTGGLGADGMDMPDVEQSSVTPIQPFSRTSRRVAPNKN